MNHVSTKRKRHIGHLGQLVVCECLYVFLYMSEGHLCQMKNPGASPQAPVGDYPPLAPTPQQPLAFRLAPLGCESGVSDL